VAHRETATAVVVEDGVVVDEPPVVVEVVEVELDPLEAQPVSSRITVSTAAAEPVRSRVFSMRITSKC
jgi:hypothetical protein